MVLKKRENVIGGITVGDIKEILKNRDNNDMVYLDGNDFYACETSDGNIEFSLEQCKYPSKDLWL